MSIEPSGETKKIYINFYFRMDKTLADVPVLIIDCNKEFVDDKTRQRSMLNEVRMWEILK